MRILHLYFQMHLPYQLNSAGGSTLFDAKNAFSEANQSEYQPLFAFLERNSQKYPQFKISLGVSGSWLEQAETWDPELLNRLKRLINLGRVQLVTIPYDYSLSIFYDHNIFLDEIEKTRTKILDYYGVSSSVLAMPELMYNDKIGQIAEKLDFTGVLIGNASSALDWRHSNQVFEAKNCHDLRLICQNNKFSQSIIKGDDSLMQQGERTKQFVFSAPKFLKNLDIEFLRGNLINLCLPSHVFATHRKQNIISFFDQLVASWLDNPQNRFYNALETIGSSEPRTSISVKRTITWSPNNETSTKDLVKQKESLAALPTQFSSTKQVQVEKALYALHPLVKKTKDSPLQKDFDRLSALDYINDKVIDLYETILVNFQQQVFAKAPQPTQLTAKAGPSRKEVPEANDDFAVKVHHKKSEKRKKVDNALPETNPEKPVSEATQVASVDLAELPEAEIVQQDQESKPKRKRLLKRIVIE